MGSKLKALWHMQNGECFYCGRATWLQRGHESKLAAKSRLGIATTKELWCRIATEEHMKRRADGGGNGMDNLVMACNECNGKRATKPVLLHLADRRNLLIGR